MTTRLDSQACQWARQLGFFAPDVADDLGRLVGQLEGAFPARPERWALEEPSGWSGLARRGPWSRLAPAQWALLEAAPEEFLRRAGQSELQFWQPAFEGSFLGQDSWLVFDSGPEQVGACRLLQLGLLLLFWKRAQALGKELLWSLAQSPERVYDQLDSWSVRAFLQGRSLAMPGRPEPPPGHHRVWFIGGSSWRGAVDSSHEFVELQPEGRESVRLLWAGRSVSLALPPAERALRLFRDPFSLASGTFEQASSPGQLVLSNCGRKVIVVSQDGLCVHPIPQSPREPLGKPRRFRLPAGTLAAVGWLHGSLTALTRDDSDPDQWSLRRLNPARAREEGRVRLPFAPAWSGQPGLCVGREPGRYSLWLDQHYWEVNGENLEDCLAHGWFQGARLSSQTGSLFVREGQVLDGRLALVHDLCRLHPQAATAGRALVGYGGGLSIPGAYAVLALETGPQQWVLFWKGEVAEMSLSGSPVLGVVPWSGRALAMVEQRPQGIRFLGPQVDHWLETGPVSQLAVSSQSATIVWQRPEGSLGFYSPTYAAMLGAV